MKLKAPFRPATIADCTPIAQLFSIASDGVTDYVWSTLADEYPGLSGVEIGAQRYANEESLFSYKNCIVAEQNREVVGMMVCFPTAAADAPTAELTVAPAESQAPDVLAPYNLEAPNTWYICALAVFPEFRYRGLGTQFLSIAHQQAEEKGYDELSLLCFEQNTGALTCIIHEECCKWAGQFLGVRNW